MNTKRVKYLLIAMFYLACVALEVKSQAFTAITAGLLAILGLDAAKEIGGRWFKRFVANFGLWASTIFTAMLVTNIASNKSGDLITEPLIGAGVGWSVVALCIFDRMRRQPTTD